jgi:hypothetical protein
MTKRSAALAALLVCAAASGCGKKGELLPPLVRTPMKPEAATVLQRGATLFVGWKNPVKSVDGMPLSGVSEAEIWALEQDRAEAGKGRTTAGDFEGKARLAAALKGADLTTLRKEKANDEAGFVYPYSLAGKKPASLKISFAVRVRDTRSRTSLFSEPVDFEPRVGPAPPSELAARVLEDKIELVWKAPAANFDGSTPVTVSGYNIYRRAGDGPEKVVNPSLVTAAKFEDPDIVFGIPVRYFVRASATEKPPYFESEDSEVRELVPEDTFPPAPPAGVVTVTGHGSVSLSWEANREKDLAGYRVRRREEGETEDVLLTPALLLENAYTDPTIEKGKRYRYSMSAVDIRGNESARTEAVVEAPGDGLE